MRTRLDRARPKGNYLEFEDVPLVEFMYLVFTRMPSESWNYLEFEDVLLVEFMYLVFTHMPGQVRVGITLNLRMCLW